MKIGKIGRIGKKRKPHRQRLAEHAAALAPPEEKAGHPQAHDAADARASADGNGDRQHLGGTFHDGSIILDTGKLHLPENLLEETERKGKLFGIEPVVIVILAIALLFICFIAYLISIQPPKGESQRLEQTSATDARRGLNSI